MSLVSLRWGSERAPWCRNCKKMEPLLKKLSAELGPKGASFIKVNTTEAEGLAEEQGVDALPTLHFFKGGKKVGQFKGSAVVEAEKAIRVAM